MKTEMETNLAELLSKLSEAASNFDAEESANTVIELLWFIAEAREDFQDLPLWIAEQEQALRAASVELQLFAKFAEIALLVASSYSTQDEANKTSLDGQMAADQELNFDYDSATATVLRMTSRLLNAAGGPKRLTVVVDRDHIQIGNHTTISFNRTLIIPEDGKDYPLPAGFGRLPILCVADYADKVPPKWLEDGGFFIPLYQKEALFLEFGGKEWQPSTAKVAVGGINAVTGDAYDEKIRAHKQDYVIIPEQKWLDGINCGEGRVGQFVAMPLGQGYTIEEQLTDEARIGGFQVAVFEAKQGRFPDEDPEIVKQRRAVHERKMAKALRDHVVSGLRQLQKDVINGHLEREPSTKLENRLGISRSERLRLLNEVRGILRDRIGAGALVGLEVDDIQSSESSNELPLFSAPKRSFQPALGMSVRRPSGSQRETESYGDEMGIARGGSIQQQIVEDTYGSESWDEGRKGNVAIHIVNSEMFERITGLKPPSSPITSEDYRRNCIPWFDAYDEHVPVVMPAKRFSMVKGIAAIDKLKGRADSQPSAPIEISAGLLRRIKVPSMREHIRALEERTKTSWHAGRFRIAHREASQLVERCRLGMEQTTGFAEDEADLFIELSKSNEVALQIRAGCNNELGRFLDAACDATTCLGHDPFNAHVLSIRAYANLRLGESELAFIDANAALTSAPNSEVGLRVRAEAVMRMKRYGDAIADANRLLVENPRHLVALRIRAESHRMEGRAQEAMEDATAALIEGDSDVFTLCTRAAAFLALGNTYDARQDVEEALHIEPENPFAKKLLSQLPRRKLR
jgi:plasmid stabilization system protein ParE